MAESAPVSWRLRITRGLASLLALVGVAAMSQRAQAKNVQSGASTMASPGAPGRPGAPNAPLTPIPGAPTVSIVSPQGHYPGAMVNVGGRPSIVDARGNGVAAITGDGRVLVNNDGTWSDGGIKSPKGIFAGALHIGAQGQGYLAQQLGDVINFRADNGVEGTLVVRANGGVKVLLAQAQRQETNISENIRVQTGEGAAREIIPVFYGYPVVLNNIQIIYAAPPAPEAAPPAPAPKDVCVVFRQAMANVSTSVGSGDHNMVTPSTAYDGSLHISDTDNRQTNLGNLKCDEKTGAVRYIGFGKLNGIEFEFTNPDDPNVTYLKGANKPGALRQGAETLAKDAWRAELKNAADSGKTQQPVAPTPPAQAAGSSSVPAPSAAAPPPKPVIVVPPPANRDILARAIASTDPIAARNGAHPTHENGKLVISMPDAKGQGTLTVTIDGDFSVRASIVAPGGKTVAQTTGTINEQNVVELSPAHLTRSQRTSLGVDISIAIGRASTSFEHQLVGGPAYKFVETTAPVATSAATQPAVALSAAGPAAALSSPAPDRAAPSFLPQAATVAVSYPPELSVEPPSAPPPSVASIKPHLSAPQEPNRPFNPNLQDASLSRGHGTVVPFTLSAVNDNGVLATFASVQTAGKSNRILDAAVKAVVFGDTSRLDGLTATERQAAGEIGPRISAKINTPVARWMIAEAIRASTLQPTG